MKFFFAALIAVATSYSISSEHSSSSVKGCKVGKNGIQAADYRKQGKGCVCPAQFRHDAHEGCLRICTLGKNGVQASFKGVNHKGKDICQCPKHFQYDRHEGCERVSQSTTTKKESTTTKKESTTTKKSSTTTKKESSSSQSSNPCVQSKQAHADWVAYKCQCPAEFQYNQYKGCQRICTLGENKVQASFQLKYDDKGKPVCVCPPPFQYIHKQGCVDDSSKSSKSYSSKKW